jgi:hypothetical protein
MGTFAPPPDSAGNSVKGQLAAQFLAERLGLNLFASRPDAWFRKDGADQQHTMSAMQEENT